MRIHKIICVFVAVLMLAGCSEIDADVLSYAERAFRADVEGQMDGLDFAAEVQVSVADESGARNIRIEFSSPESMKDIVVTDDGQHIGIRLGDVSMTYTAAQGWTLVAQLLIPRGQVVSIKNSEGNAGIATVALDSKQIVVIDLNTGAPLEASIDGTRRASVRVTRFEYVNTNPA